MYNELIDCLKHYDLKALNLEKTVERFVAQKSLLVHLHRKPRKLTQTKDIERLRKELDNLISSLLLHVKALKRAGFEEQRNDILCIHDWIRKVFKNAVHESLLTKMDHINTLFMLLKKDSQFNAAFENVGLVLYKNKFEFILTDINKLRQNRLSDKSGIEKGLGVKTKELIITELQILKTIEMNALQYPEADFTVLIREINKILTDSRKYLRNTTTRRKIRAEKAQEKGSAEGN